MRIENYRWQLNSRDIWHGTNCLEHCLLASMAVAAEEPEAVAKTQNHKVSDTIKFILAQGNDYENWVFEQLKSNLGRSFALLPENSAIDQTKMMAELGKVAIGQASVTATFEDFDYNGRADLLVRSDYDLALAEDGTLTAIKIEGHEADGTYNVWEVKHKAFDAEATKADDIKNYLNQLAMNYEALIQMKLAKAGECGIIFKNLTMVKFNADELLAELNVARKPMFDFLVSHPPQAGDNLRVANWCCGTKGECETAKCDFAEICAQTRIDNDDFSQLWNVHYTHPPKLRAHGFDTVAKMASGDLSVTGINPDQLKRHKAFAEVIVESKLKGEPVVRLLSPVREGKSALPLPSPNDLAIDFEWFTPINTKSWFYYLLGVTNRDGEVKQFVAEDESQEGAKFVQFLEHLEAAIAKDPLLNIYVVSTPEKTATGKLGVKYGIDPARIEAVVSRFFDVQSCAQNSLAVSTGGFGLKELEKFFLAEDKRTTATTDGSSSMWMYHQYLANKAEGNQAKADEMLADIMIYNAQDCLSTMMLFDWLDSF